MGLLVLKKRNPSTEAGFFIAHSPAVFPTNPLSILPVQKGPDEGG